MISNIPWNQGLANYNACMSGTPITAQYSTPTINSLSKHWLYKAYIYFLSSVLRIVASPDTRPDPLSLYLKSIRWRRCLYSCVRESPWQFKQELKRSIWVIFFFFMGISIQLVSCLRHQSGMSSRSMAIWLCDFCYADLLD